VRRSEAAWDGRRHDRRTRWRAPASSCAPGGPFGAGSRGESS
jgi:hypothetical protein